MVHLMYRFGILHFLMYLVLHKINSVCEIEWLAIQGVPE